MRTKCSNPPGRHARSWKSWAPSRQRRKVPAKSTLGHAECHPRLCRAGRVRGHIQRPLDGVRLAVKNDPPLLDGLAGTMDGLLMGEFWGLRFNEMENIHYVEGTLHDLRQTLFGSYPIAALMT